MKVLNKANIPIKTYFAINSFSLINTFNLKASRVDGWFQIRTDPDAEQNEEHSVKIGQGPYLNTITIG